MLKRRLIGVLCAVVLIMGLMPTAALAANPIVTDVVIHKVEVDQGTGLVDHDGTQLTTPPGDPMPGIIFKYWKISDTVTATEMAEIGALSTIEAAEAYAALHPTVLTGGTQTGATNASGQVTVSAMAEGVYFFAEVNGPDHNVTDYIGVPFLLELPAMKPSGTGYFGTGADALHVYPKNALKIPGLEVQTVNAANNAPIAGSAYSVQVKDSSNNYVNVTHPALTGGILSISGTLATLAELPAGEYRLVNTVAPAGFILDNRPIDFTVSAGVVTFATINATQSPKSSFTAAAGEANARIVLALTAEPVPEKDANGQNENTYAIGDVITWNVTLPVPADIADYTSFTMVDTLDTQLTWVGSGATMGNVTVKVGGTDVAPTAYTAVASAQVLTITFVPSALSAYAGGTIAVTYQTFINNTAVMGELIDNDVTINFNNGHGGTGTTRPTDPPQVWTGGFKWIKYERGNSTNVLSGAEFKISTVNTGTGFLTWTSELIAANAGGSFVTPVVGADIVMTSNASGAFEIKGLAGGTYYLYETKAPVDSNGVPYNLLRDPVDFTVTKTSYLDITGTPVNPTPIENSRGLQIPQTGGIGTVLFTVVGLGLMGLAIFMFRKKKAKNTSESL